MKLRWTLLGYTASHPRDQQSSDLLTVDKRGLVWTCFSVCSAYSLLGVCVASFEQKCLAVLNGIRPPINHVSMIVLRRLVAGFLSLRSGLNSSPVRLGYIMEIMAPRQVLSEFIYFSCQLSFHQIFRFPYLSSHAGTLGHLMPKYQGTRSQNTLRIKKYPWHFARLVMSQFSSMQ